LLSQDQPRAAVHDEEQNNEEKKEGHVTRDEASEVRFLVSSRQLRIVSPYFDNMFKRDYSETVPCLKDGLYHVQAQRWSTEAFGVILSISHQQVKAIPKKVMPALLAHILMVADYYQMGDVLAMYEEKWWLYITEPSKLSPIPRTYGEKWVYWMFLVSRRKDWKLFKDAATIFIKSSRTPIQCLGLPFHPIQGKSTSSGRQKQSC